MSPNNIDVFESDIIKYSPRILNVLLKDRTTKKNIIWATDDYEYLGNQYKIQSEIKPELIVVDNCNIIKPRVLKSQQSQQNRKKRKAEVFTPAWMCNIQNNLIDNAWFGRENVFNFEKHKSWEPNLCLIEFDAEGKKTWKNYVDSTRLEITCGEAPYLVSRYDSVTGEYIPINQRIGLLDRKMRVVNENTQLENEWFEWTKRAFQSIYGFEFQGDSLLLARENLLYTFIDNMELKFQKTPTANELIEIANIISWNIWQMNGLKYTVPYCESDSSEYLQLSFFEETNEKPMFCKIKDWRAATRKSKNVLEFRSLVKNGGKNG